MPDFMRSAMVEEPLVERAGRSVITCQTSIQPFILIFVGDRKVLVDKTLAFGRNSTFL